MMQLSMLLFVFLLNCFAEELVCEPRFIENTKSVTSVLALNNVALVLWSSSGSSPFRLSSVDFATAQVFDVVPFNVVDSVISSSDRTFCAFVSNEGILFVVTDVVLGTLKQIHGSFAVSDVTFSADSRWIVFSQSKQSLHSVSLESKSSETFLIHNDQVDTFGIAPNSSFIAFLASSSLYLSDMNGLNSRLVSHNVLNFQISTNSETLVYQASSFDLIVVRISDFSSIVLGNPQTRTQSLFLDSDDRVIHFSDLFMFSSISSEAASLQLIENGNLNSNVLVQGTSVVYLNSGWLFSKDVVSNQTQSLANGGIGEWLIGNSDKVVFTQQGDLYASNLKGTANPILLSSGDISRIHVSNGDTLSYLNTGSIYSVDIDGGNEQRVSKANVDFFAVQPSNGVSLVFMRESSAFVGCLKPSLFVEGGLFAGKEVKGHLFMSENSTLVLSTLLDIGGSLVLNDCTLILDSCLNGTNTLVSSSFINGDFGEVIESGCLSCADVAYFQILKKNYSILVTEGVVSLENCQPLFNWTAFGIVVGVSFFCFVVLLVVVILWNRRETKQAETKLQEKLDKYSVSFQPLNNTEK